MAGHFVLDAEDRHAVKDCILRSLNKLNDRDTQKTGTEELHEIFEVTPPIVPLPALRTVPRQLRTHTTSADGHQVSTYMPTYHSMTCRSTWTRR